MSKIIKDYGETITPEVYMNALQGHQYIPQADQCILNIIKKHSENISSGTLVLDLGCGPGRLTFAIADMLGEKSDILGVDISTSFIRHAQVKNLRRNTYTTQGSNLWFMASDFTKEDAFKDSRKRFDIILMQGVMHHIHGEDRVKFFKKCKDLLGPGGILIVGDEFISHYDSEEDRILNVVKFYLHIINEAYKGGFDDLAIEESKNLIDDCFSGTKYAGFANEEIFEMIEDMAEEINDCFYDSGAEGLDRSHYEDKISRFIEDLKFEIRKIIPSGGQTVKNFNRGDLKVSVDIFTKEAFRYGFRMRASFSNFLIGPVCHLGGMAVLVFEKKPE